MKTKSDSSSAVFAGKVFSSSLGFTLIELMVVVAIVGILTAIAIPQFNEFRVRSNDVSALVDAKSAAQVFAANMIR